MRGQPDSSLPLPAARACSPERPFLPVPASSRAAAQPVERGRPAPTIARAGHPARAPRQAAGRRAAAAPAARARPPALRHIFALQRAGDTPRRGARGGAARPRSPPAPALGRAMLGYILADRHLGPLHQAGRRRAAGLAGAVRRPRRRACHACPAAARLPRGARAAAAGARVILAGRPTVRRHRAGAGGNRAGRRARAASQPALDRAVSDAARAGRAAAVQRLLAGAPGLLAGLCRPAARRGGADPVHPQPRRRRLRSRRTGLARLRRPARPLPECRAGRRRGRARRLAHGPARPRPADVRSRLAAPS